MKKRWLALGLTAMLAAGILAGCSSQGGAAAPETPAPAPAETQAPSETQTPEETQAPAETQTPGETPAPAETQAPETHGGGMPDPWSELTADEAAQYMNFGIPEGAENVVYRLMETEGQEPLLEVQFDLDGRSFNMREQRHIPATEDISGMYYDWTVQDGANVWGSVPGSAYRYLGDDETVDLLTWYVDGTELSFALSVAAPSLDGFDIIAVANMMAPQ